MNVNQLNTGRYVTLRHVRQCRRAASHLLYAVTNLTNHFPFSKRKVGQLDTAHVVVHQLCVCGLKRRKLLDLATNEGRPRKGRNK